MFWRSGAESFEGAKKYTAPGPTPRAYGAPPAPGAYRFVIVLGATVFHSGLREGREASFAPKRPTEESPFWPEPGQYPRPFGRRPVPHTATALGRSARHECPPIKPARRPQESP